MEPSIVLSVGQTFHLKQFKDRIIYAGMLNEDVYSIAQRKTDGYRGFGWNLFFPKQKQDIVIDGVKLFVESVTPDEIRFRVE